MADKSVLVVNCSNELDVDILRNIRDYIIESIQLGVMVMPRFCSCDVAAFPELGGVIVSCPDSGGSQEPDPPAGDRVGSATREKRAIMERLKKYRDTHGLGCLKSVAKYAGEHITDDMLRQLLIGELSAPLSDWRRIGNAINKLEANAKTDLG